MTRVLIIEPDVGVREIKETQLRAAGYLVVGVANEDLAREAMLISPYPLLVLEPADPLPLPVETSRLESYPTPAMDPTSANAPS